MAGKACPCGSGKDYSACCAPAHQGVLAPTPEALMRSRFSAFELKLADYLLETTHPDHSELIPRQKETASEALQRFRKDLAESCQKYRFKNLRILQAGTSGNEGSVTFEAVASYRGLEVPFGERSRFLKNNGRWLYISGEQYDPLADL